MADSDAPDAEAHDAPALTPREHLDHAHDHLHHAMDGLDGVHHEPDADDEPRGNARFAAVSAQRRGGFPAGSQAARVFQQMRVKP